MFWTPIYIGPPLVVSKYRPAKSVPHSRLSSPLGLMKNGRGRWSSVNVLQWQKWAEVSRQGGCRISVFVKAGKALKFYFCERGNDVCIFTWKTIPFLPHGKKRHRGQVKQESSFACLECLSSDRSAHFQLCFIPGCVVKEGYLTTWCTLSSVIKCLTIPSTLKASLSAATFTSSFNAAHSSLSL